MKDLIILVPDKNIQFALKGIISRNESLHIRNISQSYDIFSHPHRDPGCYNQGIDFLRPFIEKYRYALIIFDHEGSGQENKSREDIETELEEKLRNSGWGNRASIIVLEPELEIWVWSDSPHVEKILGWEHCNPNLKDWLIQENFFNETEIKPNRPKEAMEEALRRVKKPRSSAIYQQLAEKVSFKNCKDDSFQKFKQVLQNWFSES